jgi:hypothetical protein
MALISVWVTWFWSTTLSKLWGRYFRARTRYDIKTLQQAEADHGRPEKTKPAAAPFFVVDAGPQSAGLV